MNFKTARAKMINQEFIKSTKYKDQQNRANREGAHPDILEFERAFIMKAKKMQIPLFTHCLYRPPDEQSRLYVQGHTNAIAGSSPHQYAMAVDIIHGTLAWNLPRQSWDILGHIGHEVALQKGINIRWGGEFRSLYDPAHWELTNWKELKKQIAA